MTSSFTVPDEPLLFIQDHIRHRRVLWTHHVNMRFRGRFIPRQSILDSVNGYEMVEEYPEDKYLPSYLILARHGKDVFHVLFATDVEGDNVRIITAYRPDPAEWLPDLKTRRTER